MKKVLLSIILVALSAANSYALDRYGRPIDYTKGYNAGYNVGYNQGNNHGKETVIKAIGATVLIGIGAVIIYEVVKGCNSETRIVATQNGVGYRF